MGRGRGRGRGSNVASMNVRARTTSSYVGPIDDDATSSLGGVAGGVAKEDEAMMADLLARARMAQRAGVGSTTTDTTTTGGGDGGDDYDTRGGASGNSSDHRGECSPEAKKSIESSVLDGRVVENEMRRSKERGGEKDEYDDDDDERCTMQDRITRGKEEEEEREMRIEEEERRRLLVLVGGGDDIDDNDENDDDGGDGRKKRGGSSTPFEFETEEEREERYARHRREERRRKRRRAMESAVEEDENNLEGKGKKKEEEEKEEEDGICHHRATINEGDDVLETIAVDRPRNEMGVIMSESIDAPFMMRHSDDGAMAPPSNAANAKSDDGGANIGITYANDSDSGSFDMFAAGDVTPVPTTTTAKDGGGRRDEGDRASSGVAAINAQECDDAEGYYKATIGEIISLPRERWDRGDASAYGGSGDGGHRGGDESSRMARFRVLGIIGKGVFSSVIKCVEEGMDGSCGASGKAKQSKKESCAGMNPEVKEEGEEEEDDVEERERRERENHNIVRLVDVDPRISSDGTDTYLSSPAYAAPPPQFRSHCVFLFEFLPYNLREVLSKFGKNVGINLTAVRSYARQLLCALAHLERHRVVHADLKPDNILVSANFSTVKVADFGSAFFETDFDNDPTPYLVSRFYRPPEVILGLEYDRMVDLWSTSVTLAELFTGAVLFPGKTNNDMLVRFMDAMGPVSHKMAKRHVLSYARMGLQPHFEVGIAGGTYQLRRQDIDRITGQPVCCLVNVLSAKADARMTQVLLRASKGVRASERVDVLKFADFLNRCLALDPARRLSVRDALRHDFFIKKKKKVDS
ncbi:hypothetical protein ACHAXA_008251 [Cyclostephanos tholiformis]|uniref:Protein kinase domain-containing protein n=1 Tax=Cyclostephanos tholiformis TaxID=382380 RepID=A0ABD3RBB7_9STRA